MSAALIFAVAWGLMVVVSLRWASKDERARQGRVGSTSAHLTHEGATRRHGGCSAECSRPASAHERETGRRCHAGPLNPRRL